MTALFLSVLNMTISAGWTVLAVLMLRLLLRKAPKWIHVSLWGLVAFRMVCPITFETRASLLPSRETISPHILSAPSPAITSGITVIDDAINSVIAQTAATSQASAAPLQLWLDIFAILWLSGIAGMLVYATVSYTRLRLRVRDAVVYRDGIYLTDQIGSAFVLGILKPRIFLPCHMDPKDMEHVIAHERSHIRRKDHWWKPLGFLLLSIHWPHPLLWLAYILFCRDIEHACDEKVIRKLPTEDRADYSQALLSCSVGHRPISACPLAFSETGIKKRVKAVLRYKKPSVALIILAVLLGILTSVFFLTDPRGSRGMGIQSIWVTEDRSADAVIHLDYLVMEKAGFHCRLVHEDEGEHTGSGYTDYGGALGKYRLFIDFGDTAPTEGFAKKYPSGEVHTFEDVPDTFQGSLRFKVVYPDDHGFAIYIGSDHPLSTYEVDFSGRYLAGTIGIKLYNSEGPNQ